MLASTRSVRAAISNRLAGVYLLQNPTQGGRNALRALGGADHVAHVAEEERPGYLLQWLVNRRLRLIHEALLADIVHDADNCEPVFG